MADKVIYMRPGETLEIRHLTHEAFDRNAKSWQAQARPERDLIRINGPHSITPATPMLECKHWKTWGGTKITEPQTINCEACGDTGRMGPFFPGGLSTICGNCQTPPPQTMAMGTDTTPQEER